MAEYRAELQATREKTARLRALRLAREAANQKPPRGKQEAASQKPLRGKQKGAA